MIFLKDFDSYNLSEGIDFEGNFTPLYHITSNIISVLKSDSLIPRNILIPKSVLLRGPSGICFTRSKFFEHFGIDVRIILNRELLKTRYKIYPLDEWSLKRQDIQNSIKSDDWVNRKVIKSNHFGKSNFLHTLDGKRPISHNIKGLPDKYDRLAGLEVEYEERVLTKIKDLHKYIYAINFITEKNYIAYKKNIEFYLEKYPNIKILIGKYKFYEVK